MRFWRVLSSIIFAIPTIAFAYDCNVPVQDPAFVLGKGEAQILSAIQIAATKGADVRVIATNDFSGTGENLANQMVYRCANWQSANGGVKNNLVFISVFPRVHLVGLFVGAEFGKVINTSEIKSEYMIPAFRDGDFVRGVTNGINQISTQIEGFHTSALHGTTVVKQATDFHGLWISMYITLGLVGLAGFFWLFFYLAGKRRERQAAQQKAVNARNRAAQFATQYPDSDGAAEFARYASSETYNPDTPGLSAQSYENIALAYKSLVFIQKKESSKNQYVESPYKGTTTTSEMKYPEEVKAAPTSNTTIINKTTYVDNTPYVPVTPIPFYTPPVIVETPVIEETYTPSSHSNRDSDYSSSSSDSGSGWSDSSSSSSWSDSGSSSSWSDTSSSSSWSDSGGGFSGGDSSW